MNTIHKQFKGISLQTLTALKHQGGFGLLDLNHQLIGARAKVIGQLLLDNTNWNYIIWRNKIQKVVEETWTTNYNHESQEYTGPLWYDFLTSDLELDPTTNIKKIINDSQHLNDYEKTCLHSWFHLTKKIRKGEITTTTYTQEEAQKLINEGRPPTQIDLDLLDKTFFQQQSRKHQLTSRSCLIPKGWSRELHYQEDQWKTFFKKLNEAKNEYPYDLDFYHKFNLGLFRYHTRERIKCTQCGQLLPARAYNTHQTFKCRYSNIIWSIAGARELRLRSNHLICNSDLTPIQMIKSNKYLKILFKVSAYRRSRPESDELSDEEFKKMVLKIMHTST